jgi:hypothetical protein
VRSKSYAIKSYRKWTSVSFGVGPKRDLLQIRRDDSFFISVKKYHFQTFLFLYVLTFSLYHRSLMSYLTRFLSFFINFSFVVHLGKQKIVHDDK